MEEVSCYFPSMFKVSLKIAYAAFSAKQTVWLLVRNSPSEAPETQEAGRTVPGDFKKSFVVYRKAGIAATPCKEALGSKTLCLANLFHVTSSHFAISQGVCL